MLKGRVTRFLQGDSEQGCAFYRKPCAYSPITWGFAGGRVKPQSPARSRRDKVSPKPAADGTGARALSR